MRSAKTPTSEPQADTAFEDVTHPPSRRKPPGTSAPKKHDPPSRGRGVEPRRPAEHDPGSERPADQTPASRPGSANTYEPDDATSPTRRKAPDDPDVLALARAVACLLAARHVEEEP